MSGRMAQHHLSRGAGPSQRQLRVGELIRRRLSEILARDELHDPDLGRLSITVGEVQVSPDLRHAVVHVMPLGGVDVPVALTALERNRGTLRRLLGRALTLKVTPDLRFRADETFDRMDAARQLFADETVRRDVASDED
jgi:ribosome-binding factor A